MRKARIYDARQLPAYLSPAQYAELMSIDKKTVQKMCRSGLLPAEKVGPRLWRIDKNRALDFLCWVMIPVVSCVKSVIRSLYPNVPDLGTSMASHVVIGIVSFFMLCVSLPLLFLGIITMHI